MSKGKVYISNYPDNPPEWYWISRWDSNKEGAKRKKTVRWTVFADVATSEARR